MQVWKEFDGNEVTHSMAHYLMAIQDLLKEQGYARVTDVAKRLEITPGSASVSLKALKSKGYVSEDHNRFLGLTEEGMRVAHDVHVANRTFIHFFEEVLGVSEEQAHIDSCKIEHLVSAEARDKLVVFLHFLHSGHPTVAPFLAALAEQQKKFKCPGPEACEICGTDVCDL
jgi:Mn-dependent DtxR family transcriptional regulator